MPGPEKVSAQQVMAALLKWRGDVKQAAEVLGISRNALYGRIQTMRLDLAAFRILGTSVRRDTVVPMVQGSRARPGEHAQRAGKGAVSTIPAQGLGRRLAPMSTAVDQFSGRQRSTPRIAPAHLERLADAKYDLQAILRRDITEREILDECLEECLGPWLERKIESLRQPAEQPAAKPKRRARGEEPGE